MLVLKSFLSLFFLFFSSSYALYGYAVVRCQFTSTRDLVYLEQFYFNKVLLGQYNSTLGKYVGYSKKAKEIADDLNKSLRILAQAKKNEEKCRDNIKPLLNLTNPVEPSVRVRPVEIRDSKQNTFSCSVYGFYPKQINLTWLRDERKVTDGVTYTDVLSSGNWLYQIHSYLEFTHIPGQKIACQVEHASLKEPKNYYWEPMGEAKWNKIAVGTSGLLIGLVFFLAGLIMTLCRSSTNGRVLVSTG
ncbi:class II histocompatibility antigen, B-L beta chain-like [Cololabis saira]|uniref:class II histocompatibility antigen, B-L beta chain-like n=1 Tax=Cololabis saira TaxID=129043 RepID=UPI002AD44BFA|nr:class II histocompatibility antigen, B-L beta chain-like [Cololabis saira]XP_061572804.1 class II histocompatibility antigen, B-L beta chain-like [Cololabis saira]